MNKPQRSGFPFQNAFEYFMINPMTNWQRFFNPQFYINYNAGDIDVENNVLRQVGSYGKQIGQIIDVLDVLVARIPPNELTPQERRAIDDFSALSQQVKAAVDSVKGPREKSIALTDIDRLIEGLQSLAHSDPDAHRLLVHRLRSAIAGVDKE